MAVVKGRELGLSEAKGEESIVTGRHFVVRVVRMVKINCDLRCSLFLARGLEDWELGNLIWIWLWTFLCSVMEQFERRVTMSAFGLY